MMGRTDGNTDKYLVEIETNFAKIKALRNELDILKNSERISEEMNSEFKRILLMFQNTNVSFNEFDDVVVRRLVECIRVMKDRRIVVVLKGGLSAEEYF